MFFVYIHFHSSEIKRMWRFSNWNKLFLRIFLILFLVAFFIFLENVSHHFRFIECAVSNVNYWHRRNPSKNQSIEMYCFHSVLVIQQMCIFWLSQLIFLPLFHTVNGNFYITDCVWFSISIRWKSMKSTMIFFMLFSLHQLHRRRVIQKLAKNSR